MPIRPGYGGTIGGLENSPAMSGAVGDRKSRPKRAAFQIDSRRGAVIEEEQNEQVRTSKKAGASVISLAPTVEGAVKIDILDGRDYCRRTAKRPFWAAARVRRTSVFTAGENLGAGAALPTPSIQIPKGGSRLWRLEPKKKDMTKGHVFLFGAPEGTRTHTLKAREPKSRMSTNSITGAYFVWRIWAANREAK